MLTQTMDDPQMTHGAIGCAGLRKILDMFAMRGAKSRWNKSFEWLTHGLRLTAAEHGLGS